METINGYTILTPFTQVGGGQCEWAQAEKGGAKYFIKRFLRPTYSDLGSPETKALRKKRCEEFEQHHRDMSHRLKAVSAGDGNLVTTKDFFRENSHYFKTTEWIDIGPDTLETIQHLPNMDKFTIALTTVHCVQGLHQAGIVHGDLKPNNILIMKTPLSYAARLIDFDDSYVTGEPPAELVGTLDYYSPEVFLYIKGKCSGSDLTTRADIFSLGIILCEYFTGRKPRIIDDGSHPDTIADAVIQGFMLETGLSGGMDDLVHRMLQRDPNDRPTCLKVIEDLKKLKSGTSLHPEPPLPTTKTSGVTITMTMRKPTSDPLRTPSSRPGATITGTTGVRGPFDDPAIEISGTLMRRRAA